MSLAQRVTESVRACFTGLWIETREPPEALATLARLCQTEQWRLVSWNIDQGLSLSGGSSEPTVRDPLAALRSVSALATPDGTVLLVLENFHRFLSSIEIVQAVARQILEGKQQRTFLVVLAPIVQIPVELQNLFVILTHERPDREQLKEIAAGIATEPGELPEGAEQESLLNAAAGLTRYEAEGAFALSLVRHGKLSAEPVWELKAGLLRTSGLLELHRGTESFETLGGLSALKAFCRRSLLQPTRNHPLRRPRGVLLLSPPGCGKSQFAKALGQETGRPTLQLDIGRLLGSLVGQSEQNIREALQIADAMSPCLLFCDELEKGLGGGGGVTDSGVSARLFGSLLTWLNDHTSDVYFVGTCNDISKLPPEFSRAERFDGVFFLDLPDAETRRAIWSIYVGLYELDPAQRLPADTDWTGAEIKSCCRLAALLDLPLVQAAHNVVPVAVTAAESVQRLRQWASGRCLSADVPGLYRFDAAPRRRRQVSTPSSN
jgi:hypothetical protein